MLLNSASKPPFTKFAVALESELTVAAQKDTPTKVPPAQVNFEVDVALTPWQVALHVLPPSTVVVFLQVCPVTRSPPPTVKMYSWRSDVEHETEDLVTHFGNGSGSLPPLHIAVLPMAASGV